MATTDRVGRGGAAARLLGALSMRGKFLALVGIALVVTLLSVGMGIRALASLDGAATDMMVKGAQPSLTAAAGEVYAARYRRLALQLVLAHTPAQASATQASLATVTDQLQKALSELGGGAVTQAQKGAVRQLVADVDAARTLFDEQLKAQATRTDLTTEESNALIDLALGDFGARMDAVAKDFETVRDTFSAQLRSTVDRTGATAGQARWLLIGTLVAGLVVLLWLGLWMSSLIAGQVARLRDAVVRLGEGDLTLTDVETGSPDEIGQMAHAVAVAVSNFRTSMTTLSGASTSLAGNAERLSTISAQVAASAEETSAQSGTAAVTSEQVARSVQSVAAATEELDSSIRDIARSTAQALQVAQQASEQASGATRTIGQLGDSSREIGEVVKVITSIAEQTNLLALNATIEAARATDDISHRIDAIQSDTRSVVEVISRISGIIAQINDFQTAIATAVEQQTATTGEMARSVGQASQGAGGISQSIEYVATAAASSSAGIGQAQHAADDLASMSGELHRIVSAFRL